jgi:hypothetical protein
MKVEYRIKNKKSGKWTTKIAVFSDEELNDMTGYQRHNYCRNQVIDSYPKHNYGHEIQIIKIKT